MTLILLTIFSAIAMTKAGTFTLDESEFHYPNVLNFYNNGLSATFNAKYSAANTPLPYIIVAGLAHLTGPGLVPARIITGIISFLTVLLAMRLLKRHGAAPYSSFVILFYPYFFLNSFVFYVVNYGLCFALLALVVLDVEQQSKSYWRVFLAGICFSLAVLCQQFYLVVPAAIALVRTLTALRQRPWPPALVRTTTANFLLANFLLVLPLIVPIWLFIKWGGLTHPNFHVHQLAFGPTTITAILFVVGIYFLPYLIQSYKSLTTLNIGLAVAAAILLTIFYQPVFSDIQGPGRFTGMTLHLLTMPAKFSPFVTSTLIALSTACGILVFLLLIRTSSTDWDHILLLSGIFLALTYIFSTQVGERHLLALMVFLFLLILPRLQKPVSDWYPWLMAAAGIGYFFYWTFFKFGAA